MTFDIHTINTSIELFGILICITASFSVGVGFALLENLIIIMQNFKSIDLFFAIVRGFSSGLMHSASVQSSSAFLSCLLQNAARPSFPVQSAH